MNMPYHNAQIYVADNDRVVIMNNGKSLAIIS